MHYWYPEGTKAGFYFGGPDEEVPELHHGGELRLSQKFSVENHTHHCWEFHLQVQGSMHWISAGKSYKVAAPGFIAIPPEVVHSIPECLESSQHHYWAGIDISKLMAGIPEISEAWERSEPVCIPQADTLKPAFRTVIREVGMQLPKHGIGLRTALTYLIVEATRLIDGESASGSSMIFKRPSVQHAIEYLERQPEKNWNLNELARLVSLSPHHLAETFTQEVGMPPHQYLIGLRVEQGKLFLSQSDTSITELAAELGFSSSQHFATTFKRITGMTPHQYRLDARSKKIGS